MKVVILFEELAPYFMVSLEKYVEKYGAQVTLFRKQVNNVAPFTFNENQNIRVLDRSEFTTDQLIAAIENVKADAIFCGGWAYAPYMNVCRKFREHIPVVLGLDNWWVGSLKQRLASLFGKKYFKNRFSSAFVPGKQQASFARKIGFTTERIVEGAYSCDHSLYSGYYEKFREAKRARFPKRFVFVGRYVEEKGIETLCNAFEHLVRETGTNWELWCLGKGPIVPREHPQIRHLGFRQPEEMGNIIEETGVFVLPSTFEPWGVAVHEFASAGYPLLLSDQVGAGQEFLREKENGFVFHAGNESDLLLKLKQFIWMSDEELEKMSSISRKLSDRITTDIWADNFNAVLIKGSTKQ